MMFVSKLVINTIEMGYIETIPSLKNYLTNAFIEYQISVATEEHLSFFLTQVTQCVPLP